MTKAVETVPGYCTATASSTGQPCKAPPVRGAAVCRVHGGNLQRVKDAGLLRLSKAAAERQALKRLRDRTGKSTTDALAEMERLVAEAIVFKDICRERLEELWARNEIRYEGKAGEQLRAEVALYERGLDRCNAILSSYVKLGISDRRAKIAEDEALLVVGVIRNILRALGLTAEQQAIATRIVPAELRAISGQIAEGEVVG